jgi:LmbE family N-acetylglucosaminyl deacetylase
MQRGRFHAVVTAAYLAIAALPGVWPASSGQSPADTRPDDHRAAIEDRARKARLLGSDAWRRTLFEFEAWLEEQPAYTPSQARAIRSDLDRRVAAMSSYELEYLIDSLEAKLRILDSPAAREAREWLSRYLTVMADRKREEVLAEVPNVLDMTTAELTAALDRLRGKRAAVEAAREATRRGREEFAAFWREQRRIDTAARTARSRIRVGDAAFSPYRGRTVADPPFTDVGDGQAVVGIAAWGPFIGVQIGGF